MDNAEKYLITARGVMRLDGARGNKQVWHPMFEPEVFRKQMYGIEVLVTCGLPRVSRAWGRSQFWRPPHSDISWQHRCEE